MTGEEKNGGERPVTNLVISNHLDSTNLINYKSISFYLSPPKIKQVKGSQICAFSAEELPVFRKFTSVDHTCNVVIRCKPT